MGQRIYYNKSKISNAILFSFIFLLLFLFKKKHHWFFVASCFSISLFGIFYFFLIINFYFCRNKFFLKWWFNLMMRWEPKGFYNWRLRTFKKVRFIYCYRWHCLKGNGINYKNSRIYFYINRQFIIKELKYIINSKPSILSQWVYIYD